MKKHIFTSYDFFWRTIHRDPVKVEEVCKVLNTLTPEQIEAVDFLIQDRRADACDDFDRE